MHDLHQSTYYSDHHVIALTETWANSSIYDAEILCDEYQIFRCDRDYVKLGIQRGGGVLLGVRNEFNATMLNLACLRENNSPLIDVVGVRVMTAAASIYIFLLYIPPKIALTDYWVVL